MGAFGYPWNRSGENNMEPKLSKNKRMVAVLIGNEILSSAARKVLERMGYEVCADMGSVPRADFAIIGSYFLWLGVVKQVRVLSPSLPLVLLATPPYELNGYSRHFFGVIELNGNFEMDAREKITKWFTEDQGKFLINRREK